MAIFTDFSDPSAGCRQLLRRATNLTDLPFLPNLVHRRVYTASLSFGQRTYRFYDFLPTIDPIICISTISPPVDEPDGFTSLPLATAFNAPEGLYRQLDKRPLNLLDSPFYSLDALVCVDCLGCLSIPDILVTLVLQVGLVRRVSPGGPVCLGILVAVVSLPKKVILICLGLGLGWPNLNPNR